MRERLGALAVGVIAALYWLFVFSGAAYAQTAGSYVASTGALAASLVAVTGPGHRLETFEVSADTTLSGNPWWIMVFDATTKPSDGTVAPAFCYAEPTGTTLDGRTFAADGPRFQTGIVVVASTTGCFMLTNSAHAHIGVTFQ